MKNVRAGALRSLVFLGRPVIVKDAAGGESLSWEEFQTWALIESISGREFLGAGAVKDAVDARITVRLVPGWEPDPRYRVRDPANGAIYNITTALASGKFGSVECLAKRHTGANDGR